MASSAVPVTGQDIFAKVIEYNRVRDSRLKEYSALRTYRVISPQGKVYAEEKVRVEYRAPDVKKFTIMRESGAGFVRAEVFKPLMTSEAETAAGNSRESSAITPANYNLQFVGREDSTACHCFVVQVNPKRTDKYLFEGTIWIDDRDYAIVKIAGRPIRSPSFWIRHAEFVRTYQKIGAFWLPSTDRTDVEMRIFGKKILTIDHGQYAIKSSSPPDP